MPKMDRGRQWWEAAVHPPKLGMFIFGVGFGVRSGKPRFGDSGLGLWVESADTSLERKLDQFLLDTPLPPHTAPLLLKWPCDCRSLFPPSSLPPSSPPIRPSPAARRTRGYVVPPSHLALYFIIFGNPDLRLVLASYYPAHINNPYHQRTTSAQESKALAFA